MKAEYPYICTNCGQIVEEDYAFCPNCGEPITTEIPFDNAVFSNEAEHFKVCQRCGAEVPPYSLYCLSCGARFEDVSDLEGNLDTVQSAVDKSMNHRQGVWKNKWIALLLCVLLGWLGAHKFYEGKIGMGVLYIFTFGLFTIGWIADIIIILFKPNPYRVK